MNESEAIRYIINRITRVLDFHLCEYPHEDNFIEAAKDIIEQFKIEQKNTAVKYHKLLEFVKESDYIDSTIEQLEINSKIPDDSYLRLQSEYILQLKQVLKEIGEL